MTNYVLNITFILAIIFGILVITSKNPIVSVLNLIGLFLVIASYLMSLGISFIGLSYLLVYVGAVSILFLFILMLINVRVSELVTDNNNSVPLSVMIVAIFNVVLFNLLSPGYLNVESNVIKLNGHDKDFKSIENLNSQISSSSFTSYPDLYVTSHTWDTSLSQTSHITAIGNVIYTSYPILLMLISIILLLAMVGAIVITIKQEN